MDIPSVRKAHLLFQRNKTSALQFWNSKFQDTKYTTFKYGFSHQGYDQLNWFGFYFGDDNYFYEEDLEHEEVIVSALGIKRKKDEITTAYQEVKAEANQALGSPEESVDNLESPESKKSAFSGITIRKNLQETAFFFPKLQTDEAGNVSFSFTTPEALTKWKLQVLAHNKTLESQTTRLETVTQKN